MKKLLYAATALAIFAGCSKDLNEAPATVSGTKGNTLELNLAVAEDSRAIFDGDSHIKWEKGDELAVVIGESADKPALANGTFKFGGDNEKPSFSGIIDDIDEEPTDTYMIFGLYPYSSDKSYNINIKSRKILLPETQNPTQTYWDGKADVMVIEPTTITGVGATSYKYYGTQYYKYTAEATIKFAHIFGFCCIDFETLPAELANESVKKVTISAIGDNKSFVGNFNVDLTKSAFDNDFALTDSGSKSALSLGCDGNTALKDYKAWFVANPGKYDIEISVSTPNYNIVFTREGLNIERSKIAYPVINFNETKDTYSSTAIDLTGGKSWVHDAAISYKTNYGSNFISSSNNPAEWGTGANMPKVEYKITFSEDANNYPGGYENLSLISGESRYAQKLNANHLTADKGNVKLASGYAYSGVNCIKITSGLSTYGEEGSCDISAFIVDKAGVKHQLGKAEKVVANTASTKTGIFDYYFYADAEQNGTVEIVWDNFVYGRAMLCLLAINPAPDIKTIKDLSLYGAGGQGTIDVEVICATETTVASDAEWLKVSYSDGKISYTAEPYDGEELSRKANITITSKGFATSTETIAVSQLSNKFAEFTLSIKPDDLTEALEKAKEEYEAIAENGTATEYTNLNFTTTLKAVIADGSGITKDVELYFNKIQYGSKTHTNSSNGLRFIKLAYGWTDENNGDIYNLTSVEKVTKIVVSNNSTSSYNNELFLGSSVDAITTKLKCDSTTPSSPYIWEGVADTASEYGFFKLHQGSGNEIYSIDVTFITKK